MNNHIVKSAALVGTLLFNQNAIALDFGFSEERSSTNTQTHIEQQATHDPNANVSEGITDSKRKNSTYATISHNGAEQLVESRIEDWLDSPEGRPFKQQMALRKINIYTGVASSPTPGVSMQHMQSAFDAAMVNALEKAAESQFLNVTGEMVKSLIIEDPQFAKDICSLDQDLEQSDLIARKSMNLATTAISQAIKKNTDASDQQIERDLSPIQHSVARTSLEDSIQRAINEGTQKPVEVDGLFVLRSFSSVTDQGVAIQGVILIEHSLTTALIRQAKGSRGDFNPKDYEIPKAFPKIDEMTDENGNNLGLYTIRDYIKYVSQDASRAPFGAQLVIDANGQLTFVAIGYSSAETTNNASRMSAYTKAAQKRAKSIANIQMQYLSNLVVTTETTINDKNAYIEELVQDYTDCSATGQAIPSINTPLLSNNITSVVTLKTQGTSIGTQRDVIPYTNPYLPDQETWLGFSYWSPTMEKEIYEIQQDKKNALTKKLS